MRWEQEPGAARGAWIRNADTKEWVALACGDTDESARRHAAMILAMPRLLEALKFVMEAHGEQLHDAFDEARKLIAELEPPADATPKWGDGSFVIRMGDVWRDADGVVKIARLDGSAIYYEALNGSRKGMVHNADFRRTFMYVGISRG